MSICSAHPTPEADCAACQATPEDLFGKEAWERMTEEARKAGTHVCLSCGFKFFKTIKFCPLCYASY